MNTILGTEAFDLWLKKLKAPGAKLVLLKESVPPNEITSAIASLSGAAYQKCVFALAQDIECISLASEI